MSDLYESDILAWSEQQATLLRRHAAGQRANDGAIDWSNVIEEVESVGREQLHAVESLLVRALVHMLKAEAWPLSRDAPSWRAEAVRFRADARRRFAPSMRQRLDVSGLYVDAEIASLTAEARMMARSSTMLWPAATAGAGRMPGHAGRIARGLKQRRAPSNMLDSDAVGTKAAVE